MGKTWELDYYSRPVFDEAGKKLWEVLLCESPSSNSDEPLFRFSKFCTGANVNSAWLKEAIAEAISKAPAPPREIRFFRRQMTNMISKACNDLGVAPKPSRRTIALNHWINDRYKNFYPEQPGYQEAPPTPSVRVEMLAPSPLPDALIGQKWAFVTLEAGAFTDIGEWDIAFGDHFPILGENSLVPEITPETPIPGLIIFSPRAVALAGWMSGLELAFLKADGVPPDRLLLETGATESWILANRLNKETQVEAKNFQLAKQQAQNVHFIAVQTDPNSESFAGFWLLQELNLS
ncbi:MAG TPA: Tab2/Atab2 family RNA-binding protein [Halomicronema sp.]